MIITGLLPLGEGEGDKKWCDVINERPLIMRRFLAILPSREFDQLLQFLLLQFQGQFSFPKFAAAARC